MSTPPPPLRDETPEEAERRYGGRVYEYQPKQKKERPERKPEPTSQKAPPDPEPVDAADPAAADHPAEDPPWSDDKRPIITVTKGDIAKVADDCEAALLAADTPIFQADKLIVQPMIYPVPQSDGTKVDAPCLVAVTAYHLIDILSRTVRLRRLLADGKPGAFVDPSVELANVMLSRSGRFRPIAGVIAAPTMRADGSIITKSGYDARTLLYYLPDPGLRVPPIPENPTREDAERALQQLKDLTREFAYKSDLHRSVGLSALMTPLCRAAFPVCPQHHFGAPLPASGKSYHAKLVFYLATGMSAVSKATDDKGEFEKGLSTAILSGQPVIVLDNLDHDVKSALLCQATEQEWIDIRNFGTLKSIRVRNAFTILSTGNNISFLGDHTRRVLQCLLDTTMERPELKEYKSRPLDELKRDRGKYIAAVLTIARAYLCAGKPIRVSPLASYEEWCIAVREPLMWLGLPDPVASMEEVRAEDPALQERRALLTGFRDKYGFGVPFQVKHLTRIAEEVPSVIETEANLREILLQVCAAHRREKANTLSHTLGQVLKALRDTTVDGIKLVATPDENKGTRWHVEMVGGA